MHRPDGAYPEQGSVVAQTTPGGVGHADILGAGNAVFGNCCVNQGGTQATGGTAADSGTVTGNQLGLPLSLPRNPCGSSGPPARDASLRHAG